MSRISDTRILKNMYKTLRARALVLVSVFGIITAASFFAITWNNGGQSVASARSAAAVQWAEQSGAGEIFAACASSNTGTWTYTAECPTACGTSASTQTQECVGGNGFCDGTPETRTCSATAACADQSCMVTNACGSSTGTLVNGVCNASQPYIPSNYGAFCYTATNSCGGTNRGTIGCDATCQLTDPLPPPDPSWLRTPCTVSNSCGMTNAGVLWCSGTCEDPTTGAPIVAPSESLCPPPPPTCTEPNGPYGNAWCQARGYDYSTNTCLGYCASCPSGQQWNGTSCVVTPTCDARKGSACTSDPNSCGQIGYGTIQCNGTCNAVTPSDSYCPALCTDPNAINYNEPLPCTYGPGVPTAWISANPSSVTSGSRSQLRWGSTDATSCTAGGPWSNSGQLSGSGLTDPLTANTTFTIQCSNDSGSSPVESATVTVTAGICTDPSATNYNNPLPCTYGPRVPTAWISVNPMSVTSGTRAQLRWGSTDATSCTAGGPWSNSGQLSGSGLTDPLTADTTYTIQCSNAAASSPIASATVLVTSSNGGCTNGATNPPTCSSCPAGQTLINGVCTGGGPTCTNGATNPPSCSSCPQGQSLVNGVCTTPPVLPPTTASLTANPRVIISGQSSTLTWSSNNATDCDSLSSNIFSTNHSASGRVTVSPTQTSSYGIVCRGPGGSSGPVYETVTVIQPSATINANPVRVQSGKTSTISWSSTDVTSCEVSGPGLSVSSKNGSQQVTVTSQSTYTITCETAAGSPVTKSVTVNVSPVFQEF